MEPRRNTDFWCDVALACVGWLYLTFAYAIVALQITHVNLCPFALVTGFPCPLSVRPDSSEGCFTGISTAGR